MDVKDFSLHVTSLTGAQQHASNSIYVNMQFSCWTSAAEVAGLHGKIVSCWASAMLASGLALISSPLEARPKAMLAVPLCSVKATPAVMKPLYIELFMPDFKERNV